jgi:hypothetical protein
MESSSFKYLNIRDLNIALKAVDALSESPLKMQLYTILYRALKRAYKNL